MLRVGVGGDRHGEWAEEPAASVRREEQVDLRAGIRITVERAGGGVEGGAPRLPGSARDAVQHRPSIAWRLAGVGLGRVRSTTWALIDQ